MGCDSGRVAERQHIPSVGIRGQYLGGPELVKGFCPQLWGPGDTFGCGIRITGSGINLGFEPQLPPDHRLWGRLSHLSKSQRYPSKNVGLSEVLWVGRFCKMFCTCLFSHPCPWGLTHTDQAPDHLSMGQHFGSLVDCGQQHHRGTGMLRLLGSPAWRPLRPQFPLLQNGKM